MAELPSLRVAKLGKPALWFVGEALSVLKIVPIPPVKQCLRHISHGMVDRTPDEIVVLLVDIVVECQHAVAERKERLLLSFEASGELLQPPTHSMGKLLQRCPRHVGQYRSHLAP